MSYYAKDAGQIIISNNDDYNPAEERFGDGTPAVDEFTCEKYSRQQVEGAAGAGTEVDIQNWSGKSTTWARIKNLSKTNTGSVTCDIGGGSCEPHIPPGALITIPIDDDTGTNPKFVTAGVVFDVLFFVRG